MVFFIEYGLVKSLNMMVQKKYSEKSLEAAVAQHV